MDSELLKKGKDIEYKLDRCNECLGENIKWFTAEKWIYSSYKTYHVNLPEELMNDIKSVIIKWRDKYKRQLENL